MAVKSRDIHVLCLAKSTALSSYYVPDLITPSDVIRVLNRAQVRFLLAGAHGIGGWTRMPRSTEDVDIIVASRGHKKAVAALVQAYPNLQVEDTEVVTRFRDPGDSMVRIDLMKPNQPIIAAALKHTYTVRSARKPYRIPSLEMALALKFAAMISPNRADEKRHTDASDFISIVKSNADIDLDKLEALGDLAYPGGGSEVIQHVQNIRAGKKIEI